MAPLALSFASPSLLLSLLAIPAIVGIYAARPAPPAPLRRTLHRRPGPGRRPGRGRHVALARHVPAALLLAALAALLVALAKPQTTVAVPVEKASVMLVTDASGSMRADDVSPSRLAAAQQAGRNFLDKVPDELQVGGVAFSDVPQSVAPPTTDRADVRSLIDSLQADGGTAAGDALQSALDALDDAGVGGQNRPPAAIILLSDGATTTGADPVEVAREAGKRNIPIYTVALGTPDGTVPGGFGGSIPVPPDPGDARRDLQGVRRQGVHGRRRRPALRRLRQPRLAAGHEAGGARGHGRLRGRWAHPPPGRGVRRAAHHGPPALEAAAGGGLALEVGDGGGHAVDGAVELLHGARVAFLHERDGCACLVDVRGDPVEGRGEVLGSE